MVNPCLLAVVDGTGKDSFRLDQIVMNQARELTDQCIVCVRSGKLT